MRFGPPEEDKPSCLADGLNVTSEPIDLIRGERVLGDLAFSSLGSSIGSLPVQGSDDEGLGIDGMVTELTMQQIPEPSAWSLLLVVVASQNSRLRSRRGCDYFARPGMRRAAGCGQAQTRSLRP